MIITEARKHPRKRLALALGLAGAFAWSSAVAAAGALAGTHLNTIDDQVRVRDAGRLLVVTGPIGCPEGQLVDIHVKVSQDSGATGTGRFSARCTGDADTWLAIVDAWGPAFQAGDASAHAWATTWDGGRIARSWDWSKDVVLAGQ